METKNGFHDGNFYNGDSNPEYIPEHLSRLWITNWLQRASVLGLAPAGMKQDTKWTVLFFF